MRLPFPSVKNIARILLAPQRLIAIPQRLIMVPALLFITATALAQYGSQGSTQSGSQNSGQAGSGDVVDKALQKGQQAATRIQNMVAVFEPYLLKAQELYGQGKQFVRDVKGAVKGNASGSQPNYGNTGSQPNYGNTGSQPNYGNTGPQPAYGSGSQPNNGSQPTYGNQPASGNTQPNYGSQPASGNTQPNYGNTGSSQSGQTAYAAGQRSPETYLPVNNPSSVNTDGSGNWGNQNNGLYGNCLDALTGTVLGMGEAADKPTSVDLLFFAPDDGQNTYYIMTPGFARNNSTATYMTQHTSDQVQQWKDVTESEVALTRLTLGQFDQIRNNGQISSAVRNAQDYSGYYASVGRKLDGQVLAVKVHMDNREVYALIAIVQQIGTSGSSGYCKIRIKALGIDNNNNGIPDANNYIR